MKVEVCIECAGKYLTGQYDPVDEAIKRKAAEVSFEKGTCAFCGKVAPSHLLIQRASGGALVDLKTGEFIRKWCSCG